MSEIVDSYISKKDENNLSDPKKIVQQQCSQKQLAASLSADCGNCEDNDQHGSRRRNLKDENNTIPAKGLERAPNSDDDSDGSNKESLTHAPVLEDDKWQDDEPQTSNDGNMSIVASHYNELKETGRKQRLKSRIVFMRNFNNWIKSQLISEYMSLIKQQQRVGDPIRVLDLCCGKGGDLLKWEKANITHLICTDIAEVSVEQCKRRYEELAKRADNTKFANKFSAEFIACDATLVRQRERYMDKSLKLNLVSCQFAFHYSFESLTQADCMMRNAAECLQPGGYFIATIPDANEIMRRLRQSKDGSFGNELYRIEFLCDTDPPPLFGAKYQFHLEGVVDCPEFLVYWPLLVKLCRKHGLKFERKTSFADYYKESLNRGQTLLQRMNGLETVYSNRCGNDEEYAHLRNFTKGNNLSKPFGTLSKSEWEATTLYLVCAFKKCRNTWDSEGKPVYEFD